MGTGQKPQKADIDHVTLVYRVSCRTVRATLKKKETVLKSKKKEKKNRKVREILLTLPSVILPRWYQAKMSF